MVVIIMIIITATIAIVAAITIISINYNAHSTYLRQSLWFIHKYICCGHEHTKT